MQTRQEPSRSVYQLKDNLCVYYMGPEDTFCGNASVEVDGNLICWGGTMGSSQTYRHPDKLYILPVQVINPSSPYWLEATCSRGNIPPCTSGASMLCVDDKLILFGGFAMQWSNILNDHVEDWTNKLYILSMSSLAWNDVKLPQEQYQPSPRDKCTSWIHRKMCYFFGGYGTAFDHIDPRLSIMRNGDQRLSDDGLTMWNNQLLQFDSKREKWIFVETIGLVPSPRAAAASCKKGRMVFIFGGRSGPTRLNDLFRMDMESLTWTPLETTNSPEGRSWCTLTTNSDSHLYLWGGMLNKPGGIENPVDDAYRISNDIYAVDVKARTWVKLNCCRFFRFWHTTIVHNGYLCTVGGRGGYESIIPANTIWHTATEPILETIQIGPSSLRFLAFHALPVAVSQSFIIPYDLCCKLNFRSLMRGHPTHIEWAKDFDLLGILRLGLV